MISIIIPTFKRSENLCRAIDSVLQQEGNYELIVVDDNDPHTEYRKTNEMKLKKYLKNSKFKYIKHEKNKNGAAARNTGINNSKGEYITFLDDDDEFCEKRIKKIEDIIKKNKPDFICTGIITKRNGNTEKNIIPSINKDIKSIQTELLKQKSFFATGSNIVCKKELVTKINGFDETFIRHQDIEFVIRILDNCKKIYCIPEYLVIKHMDDSSNVPPFNKMVQVKEKFLNKFSYIIEKLDAKEQNEILINNYYELLGNAYYRREKENLKECKRHLKNIGIYSFRKDFLIHIKHIVKRMYITKIIRKWIRK